jgi:hypothetical protein
MTWTPRQPAVVVMDRAGADDATAIWWVTRQPAPVAVDVPQTWPFPRPAPACKRDRCPLPACCDRARECLACDVVDQVGGDDEALL